MFAVALQPLLAVDAGLIVFIIIMALSGINWLMSNMGGKNQPKRPAGGAVQPPRKAANRGLQDEIDNFLAEVGGKKPPQQRKRQPVKPVDKPRRPEPARQPARPLKRKTVPVQSKGQPKRSLAQSTEKPVSWELGDTVRAHIQQHLPENHLDSIVNQDMGPRIDDSMKSRFGIVDSVPQEDQTQIKHPATAKLANLLRDPEGVRQAILVNEVLSRPLALRKN